MMMDFSVPATRRLVALGVTAALALFPLGGKAADPYEVNVILSQTGGAAFIGKEEAAAIGMIETAVNKAGGIGGRPIKFAIQDDATNPQTAVLLLNGLIAKNAPIVLGPSLNATCSAMAPLLKNGPFEYCLSPGVHPEKGTYIFSGNISTLDLLAAAARYFHARGWSKIAIIASNDATGQDLERNIDANFNAASGEAVIAREHFNTTDVSVTAQMTRIKESGAQAMVALTTGTPLGTVLRGANEVGLAIPVLTSNGNATYAQMRAYAGFLPKELLFPLPPALTADQLPKGPVKQAVADYVSACKAAGLQPDMGLSLAWDPALLIVDALKKLGPNATAAQVRDYLAGLKSWNGITGHYDFTKIPQRGVGVDSVVLARWDAGKNTWIGVSKPGGAPL